MINLVAFDAENDTELLQGSYNAIKNKDSLEIILDKPEQEIVLTKIKAALTIRQDASLSFQNLFKLSSNGQFYIAQCLINYGFSASSKSHSFNVHTYDFQIVGIADIKINLGKTLMRTESRTDKIAGRFFGDDIDLDGTKQFNDKYYLVSDNKETVISHFNKRFVNTIAKYDNLLLITRGNEICITFDTAFEENHSATVEDIFSNCDFIMPHLPR